MTDPSNDVAFHDPFSSDFPLGEDLLYFSDLPNPNFSDIPLLRDPDSSHYLNHPSKDEIAETAIDPFKDSFIWGQYDNFNGENPRAASMEVYDEKRNGGETPQPPIPCLENSVSLPARPIQPLPFTYTCSYCQILREIIHTNGSFITKLEVHGRPGLICHAVLENRYTAVDGIPPGHQMIDLCKKSLGNVKQFLQQYCHERRQAGFTMLQDPLALFYESICVGLDLDESLNTDDFFQLSPVYSGGCRINQAETEPENQTDKTQKISLAAQRERTGRLTLHDFTRYFHLPIEKAAEGLNVCPTVVKKICRKHGVERWPYRKVRSIYRQMLRFKASLKANDAAERVRAQAEIERLKQEMASACGGIAIPIPKYPDKDH